MIHCYAADAPQPIDLTMTFRVPIRRDSYARITPLQQLKIFKKDEAPSCLRLVKDLTEERAY